MQYLNRCSSTKQVAALRRLILLQIIFLANYRRGEIVVSNVQWCDVVSCLQAVLTKNGVHYYYLLLNIFLTTRNGSFSIFQRVTQIVCGVGNSKKLHCGERQQLTNDLQFQVCHSISPYTKVSEESNIISLQCSCRESLLILLNKLKSSYKKTPSKNSVICSRNSRIQLTNSAEVRHRCPIHTTISFDPFLQYEHVGELSHLLQRKLEQLLVTALRSLPSWTSLGRINASSLLTRRSQEVTPCFSCITRLTDTRNCTNIDILNYPHQLVSTINHNPVQIEPIFRNFSRIEDIRLEKRLMVNILSIYTTSKKLYGSLINSFLIPVKHLENTKLHIVEHIVNNIQRKKLQQQQKQYSKLVLVYLSSWSGPLLHNLPLSTTSSYPFLHTPPPPSTLQLLLLFATTIASSSSPYSLLLQLLVEWRIKTNLYKLSTATTSPLTSTLSLGHFYQHHRHHACYERSLREKFQLSSDASVSIFQFVSKGNNWENVLGIYVYTEIRQVIKC